jgi:hypothetical protein
MGAEEMLRRGVRRKPEEPKINSSAGKEVCTLPGLECIDRGGIRTTAREESREMNN